MSGKKVLVLEASPRKNGNSDLLADAFIKGAKESGCTVTKIYTADLDIHGCRACNGCWNSKGNCVIKDGMKEVEPCLEKADVLVVSTPIYWSMVPSEMKAVIDRIYQYDPVNGGKHLAIGESVLLATGETENASDFDMLKAFYKGMCEFNGMKVICEICVPNVNLKGDIKGNEALVQAEEAGRAL